jgi:DNA-binding beta-propeller fold protein YncE
MKFSPCGNKLAAAIGYQDTVQVFDFDVSTGIISNPLTIAFQDHVYGVEFSHDAQMLYVTTYDASGTLVQFDLSSGIPATIIASSFPLSTQPDLYALQIGPDSNIYAANSWSPFLAVINDPQQSGLAANFVLQGVLLDPSGNGITSALGLPGFVQSYFRVESSCTTVGLSDEIKYNEVSLFPNPSSDEFILDLKNELIRSLIITDASGRVIENIKEVAYRISIGSDWSPGFYRIHVLTDDHIYNLSAVKAQ